MEICPKCKEYFCSGFCQEYAYIAELPDGDLWGEGIMYGQTHKDIAEKVARQWNSSNEHIGDEIIVTVGNGKSICKLSVTSEPVIEYCINEITE